MTSTKTITTEIDRRFGALVALVVLAMMATASPAFAAGPEDRGLHFLCTDPVSGEPTFVNGGDRKTLEEQGFTCVKVDKRR